MKLYMSHGAYAELQRRTEADRLRQNAGNPLAGPSAFGMPIVRSGRFPQRLDCNACAGTGEGGAQSTYCRRCAGAGATIIDGALVDHHGFRMQLLTRPLPKAFAVSFPATVTVPAAPMRGRIKEVRLS